MDPLRTLKIPVVVGTARKGRTSVHAARFISNLLNRRAGVSSEIVDIAGVPLPTDDAGEAIKDPTFSATMNTADGLVIVAPEYNHSFPGLLKHALDSCLTEYIHKAVGLVGVSSGPFAGIRVVQSLLPVMRELGLVTIFWDINIGQIGKVFSDDGRLLDDKFITRADRFIRELIWMSKTLQYGREHMTIDDEAAEIVLCSICGASMTHHADKLVPAVANDEIDIVAAAQSCPSCGASSALLTGAAALEHS